MVVTERFTASQVKETLTRCVRFARNHAGVFTDRELAFLDEVAAKPVISWSKGMAISLYDLFDQYDDVVEEAGIPFRQLPDLREPEVAGELFQFNEKMERAIAQSVQTEAEGREMWWKMGKELRPYQQAGVFYATGSKRCFRCRS